MRPGHFFGIVLLCVNPAVAFRWVNNVNFTECYANYVQTLPQDCNDTERQVCVWKKGILTNPNRTFLAYDYCQQVCGDGYGIWEVTDILLRFSIWVIPAIVLLGHYHFPQLGVRNMLCVIAHLLADPIDSLWCLLTRIQTHHELFLKAKQLTRPSTAAAIATVWASYDELNFQDASGQFIYAMREHSQNPNGGFLAGIEADLPPSRVMGDAANARLVYQIQVAAQRLVFNRAESSTATMFAIFGLTSAMVGAYVRTWSARLDNQTAHTIATVTLLFSIVPLVKLSGNIGAFTSSTAPINIIQSLRADLRSIPGVRGEWFPELNIPHFRRLPTGSWRSNLLAYNPFRRHTSHDSIPLMGMQPFDFEHEVARPAVGRMGFGSEEERQLAVWPYIAAYTGMNSIYRPHKTSALISGWMALWLFVKSLLWLLGLCYTPAMLISYFTPLRGFACRSVAWTVIAACWVVNVLTDLCFVWCHNSAYRWVNLAPNDFQYFVVRVWLLSWGGWARWIQHSMNLWRLTVTRDVFFTLFISMIVLAQQVGLFNSCYCRSGQLSHVVPSSVNLTPFTDSEWIQGWLLWVPASFGSFLLSLGAVWWVQHRASDSSELLNRRSRAREQMLVNMKKWEIALVEPTPTPGLPVLEVGQPQQPKDGGISVVAQREERRDPNEYRPWDEGRDAGDTQALLLGGSPWRAHMAPGYEDTRRM